MDKKVNVKKAGWQGNVKVDDNPARLKQFTTAIIDLKSQIPISKAD